MHPVMTEMLAAERIREMVARGDAARCVRQARPGRRARQAGQAGQACQGRQLGPSGPPGRSGGGGAPGRPGASYPGSDPAHRAPPTGEPGKPGPHERPGAAAHRPVGPLSWPRVTWPRRSSICLSGSTRPHPRRDRRRAAGCREGQEPRDAGKGEKEYRFRWRFRTPLGPQAELQAHRLCGVSPRPVFPARTERTSGHEEGLPCPALRTPVLQTPVLQNRCCKDRHVNAPAARPAEPPVPEAGGETPPGRG